MHACVRTLILPRGKKKFSSRKLLVSGELRSIPFLKNVIPKMLKDFNHEQQIFVFLQNHSQTHDLLLLPQQRRWAAPLLCWGTPFSSDSVQSAASTAEEARAATVHHAETAEFLSTQTSRVPSLESWPCVSGPRGAVACTSNCHRSWSRSSCGKITWHQNSRFKLREENKSLSTYSRVVLENLIRCTAAEMCYLTVATYINKSVT